MKLPCKYKFMIGQRKIGDGRLYYILFADNWLQVQWLVVSKLSLRIV